jgi:hypothetical protein
MAVAIGVSLVAGFAAGAVLLRTGQPEALPSLSVDDGRESAPAAGADARIAALEAAVAQERSARQLLEEELLVLFAELDELRDGNALPANQSASVVVDVPAPESGPESFRERRESRNSIEARTDALVEVGFSADRAAWILQREDQLRVEAMQARFDAQRSGDMQAMSSANTGAEAILRSELGDADYEQYLEAYDRPTSVRVGNVLESSPGHNAGLQRGDEIVRYDGQRVFSFSDLNNQQLQGNAGENVVVDILREGAPMQVVMPRGPIGIEARRSWRR